MLEKYFLCERRRGKGGGGKRLRNSVCLFLLYLWEVARQH